jgi:tetraacyldisaccharide 4'-kinase
MLFDIGILPTAKYDFPIISVGNLTVGGTGKTPHVEYLISMLSSHMPVAMLSRGYMRKTKGYLLATQKSTSSDIGDEPYQIKRKFGDRVVVAVDANRRRGIDNLYQAYGAGLGVVLLDDAYQHRYVEAVINILLTDFNRLFTDDAMLPMGNLREPAYNKKRANIVIVTKCPSDIKPIDFRLIGKKLALQPYQNLYFTQYQYLELEPVFKGEIEKPVTKSMLKDYHIMLFSGIVSQRQLADYLATYTLKIVSAEYPDHYDFQQKDFEDLEGLFGQIDHPNKVIITTEKDAARLQNCPFVPEAFKKKMFYVPIKVHFMLEQEKVFNNQILSYVRKNKTNSKLHSK